MYNIMKTTFYKEIRHSTRAGDLQKNKDVSTVTSSSLIARIKRLLLPAQMEWTFIKTCCVVNVVCSLWNLYGDIYFLDFYTAHMSFDGDFAAINSELQPGNIFNFDDDITRSSKIGLHLAQAGGWMYPIWAYATVVPLYIGLKGAGFWNSMVPCGVLAYGLCIMGGALHSAFAFLAILPTSYHHLAKEEEYRDLTGSSTFFQFLNTSQANLVQHFFFGFLPGYIACNVGGFWVLYVVFAKSDGIKFSKWFNLFNPIATMVWITTLSTILPDPWGFYIYGCLGTWGVFIFNVGTSYFLWDDTESVFSVSPATETGDAAAYTGSGYVTYDYGSVAPNIS